METNEINLGDLVEVGYLWSGKSALEIDLKKIHHSGDRPLTRILLRNSEGQGTSIDYPYTVTLLFEKYASTGEKTEE